jgi:hypothetical protein
VGVLLAILAHLVWFGTLSVLAAEIKADAIILERPFLRKGQICWNSFLQVEQAHFEAAIASIFLCGFQLLLLTMGRVAINFLLLTRLLQLIDATLPFHSNNDHGKLFSEEVPCKSRYLLWKGIIINVIVHFLKELGC